MEIGDEKFQALALIYKGINLAKLGNEKQADDSWRRSLDLGEKNRDLRIIKASLWQMLQLSIRQENHSRARLLRRQAVPILCALEEWSNVVSTLYTLLEDDSENELEILPQIVWILLQVPNPFDEF